MLPPARVLWISCLLTTVPCSILTAHDPNRDQPNPIEFRRIEARRRLLDKLRTVKDNTRQAEADSLAKTGEDRVLVILVEFGGSDTFLFTPSGANASTWDPIGKMDGSEWAGKVGDCSKIVEKYSIKAPTPFTYAGPLHNQIERPLSATDLTSTMVWTEDFSPAYYRNIIFGDGTTYRYARQDKTTVNEDLRGLSVRSYYQDMSGGLYDITGEVVGWVKVPHSVVWYGADPCPGRRSAPHSEPGHNGGIPAAGSARTLVVDAIEAVKRQYPNFDWAHYDADADGVIDHLWIIAAGTSEADSVLINRTPYGENGLWDHAASVTPAYTVTPGVRVEPYIMMVENVGVATLVHEYGHDLGAIDLYSYGGGRPSAGFWTTMSDNWVGNPISSTPPAMDPWHLDNWGWLNPLVISDPALEYTVRIGQTSKFPGGGGGYRGVKIELEDGHWPLSVAPLGARQWWGGNRDMTNSMMTLATPLEIPAAPSTLSFQLSSEIEKEWDFLWVQASADEGVTWKSLTNEHTTCTHDRGWIGGAHGFPEDLCAAGMGGLTGKSSQFPAYGEEVFDLGAFAGQRILLRFWYMTDWSATESGPFLDDVKVQAGDANLLDDPADNGDGNWVFTGAWQSNDGTLVYKHAYYLQWRNPAAAGSADAGLVNPTWRFAPVSTGLLIWYNNDYYNDNEIQKYLFHPPSFGPKGKLLLFDAHPEPYRDPGIVSQGFDHEGGNLGSRVQMRDAPFSRESSTAFSLTKLSGWITADATFPGRPGVSVFSDAKGYYPGAALVVPSPTDAERKWVTAQWDSSAVVPSRTPYPLKAPGFQAGQPLLFNCSADVSARKMTCDSFGLTGRVQTDGGSGDPSETGGQYGWNVEIVEQSPSGATLRIWNSRP